jgi:toxin CcdB
MAQFDVYPASFAGDPTVPYMVSLQSDLLAPIQIAVVAPLRSPDHAPSLGKLTPAVTVLGKPYVLMATELVSLARRRLGPPVANIAADRDRIIAALDFLFTGI